MRRAAVSITAFLLSCTIHADEPALFSAPELHWIQEHPVVRYAIDPYWPVEYLEGTEHRGLTRDYLDQIARVSGLKFERVETANWTQTLEFIDQNRVDLTTAVTKSLLDDSVQKKLLLSDDYFIGSTVVVTRSGEPVLLSHDKLNGKKVAVKGGGAYEGYLRKHYPDVKLSLITDPEKALEALASKRVDIVIGLDVVLQPIIMRRFFGTLYLAGVLTDMPVISVMGINPRHPELRSIINKSLARVDHEYSDSMSMVDRWLASTHYGPPSWGAIVRYYSWELAVVALLLVAVILLASRAMHAQRAAQRSEADKTAFLAMMSHEIRTPMNGVLSSIELLQSTPLTAPQQELGLLAIESAQNLLELLDDVLDISKLEAKKVDIEYSFTDLSRLAQGVVNIYTPRALSNQTVLTLNTSDIQNKSLLIDPTRIRQVISNLLSNAVKFTQDGEVQLDLLFDITGPGKGRLCILVSDSGIGIEQQQQGRLFRAFAQANNSITRRYGGSGLGLSICKQLVELMDGQINLTSQPGEGTKVSCTLPVTFMPASSATPYITEPAVTHVSPTASQHRVLVVEDHPVNQKTITLQLQQLGYRVLIARDGAAALAAIDSTGSDISIVLLDCHLPDISGYEVARRIRQQENEEGLAHLPIIAISASTDSAHQFKCVESGIDGNLAKPLSLHALQQLFELWLPSPKTCTSNSPADAKNLSLHVLFLQTGLEDAAHLRAALQAQNKKLALHYAHRLHGSALTAGDKELADSAGTLEQKIRDADDGDIQWALDLDVIDKALVRLADTSLQNN